MSIMKLKPVFACRYCGHHFTFSSVMTAKSDEDGALLTEIMKNLPKIPCKQCNRRYAYHSEQNRPEDFILGPARELIVVRNEDPEFPDHLVHFPN